MPQVADDPVGAVAVGLVDDEDVGDLEDPGLGRLDGVAHAGREQDQGGVGEPGDVDLGLADADGLDEHDVAAGGRQHAQRLRRRPRQPAEVPAGGHRADEDAVVGGVVLHADAVAEQRPAGERRARVDGQHADAHPAAAVGADEHAGRGALADAGRAGEADRPGRAPARGASRAMTSRSAGLASSTRLISRPTARARRAGSSVVACSTSASTSSGAARGRLRRGRAGRRPGRRRRTARPHRRRRRGAAARGRAVSASRAPDAPIGWPSAMAPPLGLKTSLPRPRSRCEARPTAANASLTSIARRSSSATSLLASAARMALAGCSCRLLSGPATTPWAPISARTRSATPSCSALARDMTTTAAAPSEICEALPAVMVPSLRNAGFRRPSVSAVVPGRTPSSSLNRTGSPLRCGTGTSTISSGEAAVLDRGGGQLVAAGGVLVLLLAGEAVGVVVLLGRLAHRLVVEGVEEPVVEGGVDELGVAVAVALARLGQQVRRLGHRLHAAGDDDLELAGADELVGHRDGAQARQADLVDGDRRARSSGCRP